MKSTHWGVIFGFAIFVIGGCLGALPGCGTVKAIGIEAKIRRHAPIGSSIAQVDEFLQGQGIEHSNSPDGTSSITYSQIRFTRSGFLISQHLQIVFMFDYRGRLTHYRIQPWGDGP